MKRRALLLDMPQLLIICYNVLLGAALAHAASSMCDIVCDGPILACVQNSRIFPDSKTFVDLSLAREPDDVLQVNRPPQTAFLHLALMRSRRSARRDWGTAGDDRRVCARNNSTSHYALYSAATSRL